MTTIILEIYFDIFRVSCDCPLRERVRARHPQEAGVGAEQEQRRGGEDQAAVSDRQPERGGGGGDAAARPNRALQELPRAGQVHAPGRRQHPRRRHGHGDPVKSVAVMSGQS